MTRALGRVVWRSSWGGGAVDRGRALLIAGAAALSAVVIGALWSAGAMQERIEARDRARSFAVVRPGEQADLERVMLFDEAPDGEQIFIVWYRRLADDVRVPGVPPDVPDGSWYLSPALAHRAAADAGLRHRFPGARVLGNDGVGSARELLAYRFVAEPALFAPERGGQKLTTARLDDRGLLDAAEVRSSEVFRGGLVLLGLPLLGLMAAAVATISPALTRRLQILRALGAAPGRLSTVAVAQGITCALPGAVIGGVVWSAGSSRLAKLPLVAAPVLPGDLDLSPVQLGAVVGVVLAGTGVVSAVGRRRILVPSLRPMSRPAKPPAPWRILGLLAALALLASGSGVVGDPDNATFLVGLVMTAIGGSMAFPLAFDALGRWLARAEDPLSLLVGRRLRGNAVASTRGLVAAGAFVVLVPVTASWIGVQRSAIADEPRLEAPPPVAMTGPVAAGEVDAVRAATGAVPLLLYAREGPQGPEGFLVGDCAELTRRGFADGCAADGGFALVGDIGAGFVARDLPAAGAPDPPPGSTLAATLFVSEDWRATDSVLRALAANRTTPGPAVALTVDPLHENPAVRWVVGGLATAGSLAGLALVAHLAAQAVRLGADRSRLRFLGAEPGFVRRLSAAEAAISVLVAGLLSVALGGVVVWFYRNLAPAAGFPAAVVVAMLVTVAGAGGICAGISWLAVSPIGETEKLRVTDG